MEVNRLRTIQADFQPRLEALLHWDSADESAVDDVVREVLRNVRTLGDEAVLRYTREFDRLQATALSDLDVSSGELQAALSRIGRAERTALETAAARIRTYHEHQKETSWSFEDAHGNTLGQQISPLQRVGVYVPGGQASYPSSVLMTLIPARVAGVEELVVTVPTPDGVRSDTVLAALAIAGADRVVTIGGAQAVGALAYGTQSIDRVDKIVGPGGAFVAAAKRQVFGHVGIDIIAGPSEVLIIADGSTDPEWAALDLFAQAEHDAAAQAVLLSPDPGFLDAVAAHMERLLPQMSRRKIIAASLATRGALIETADLEEAVKLANRIAPEHLQLHVCDVDAWLPKIRNAGAIFCGAFASESLGDYAAGPSHVLPTFGTARFASPLGVYDFTKRSSVIRVSADGAAHLADVAVPLANSESLQAHALSAAARAQQPKAKPRS